MGTRLVATARKSIGYGTVLILLAGTSFAADKTPTAEQRKTMADRHAQMSQLHAKMATCLNSNKDFAECRSEMAGAYSQHFGANCPMGGGHMEGHMAGHGAGMMNGEHCWNWADDLDDKAPAAKKTTK